MENPKLKKKGVVFQVVGMDTFNNVKYTVMATRKDAEKYVELNKELSQLQIIPIDVFGVKKS